MGPELLQIYREQSSRISSSQRSLLVKGTMAMASSRRCPVRSWACLSDVKRPLKSLHEAFNTRSQYELDSCYHNTLRPLGKKWPQDLYKRHPKLKGRSEYCKVLSNICGSHGKITSRPTPAGPQFQCHIKSTRRHIRVRSRESRRCRQSIRLTAFGQCGEWNGMEC
jgi:hypothetical protein